MSALGGVLMFGGAPVDPEQLVALGARLDRLGPDGGREVTARAVGMIYRAFHTNAESRREHQPYCRDQRTVICWDGRLDNREELRAQLRDELRGEDTDIAIAMAAYRRWRTEGIAKLVGDFALAIWDPSDHAVWLARDCVGTRTLYYHVNHERVLWSTDLGTLLDVSGVAIEVDDEYVAGFLTRGPEPGLTPYVNIHAVKPAHAVRIDEDGLVSEQRFWALDPRKEIRYRTDADYEEHFRGVFREAVRARLRSDRPVFAELSGGLDSSSIVCMAADVLTSTVRPTRELHTVSYVFPGSSTSDETKWISGIEAHTSATSHHIDETTFRHLTPLSDRSMVATPTMTILSCAYDLELRRLMAGAGARVLLSGFGGDHMLYSTSTGQPELADLFASRRFVSLHRRLKVWSAVVKEPYTRLLWRDAVRPNVGGGFERADRTKNPRWLALDLRRRPEGFTPDGLADVLHPVRPSIRHHTDLFARAVGLTSAGYRQELGGADHTYPFLDRRFVEFMCALPVEQKLRPGETRSIMRRSLAGLVPQRILARKGKANPSEVTCQAIARRLDDLSSLVKDLRLARHGYVNREPFALALIRAATGAERQLAALTASLALELWLRAVEDRTLALTASQRRESMPPVLLRPAQEQTCEP